MAYIYDDLRDLSIEELEADIKEWDEQIKFAKKQVAMYQEEYDEREAEFERALDMYGSSARSQITADARKRANSILQWLDKWKTTLHDYELSRLREQEVLDIRRRENAE